MAVFDLTAPETWYPIPGCPGDEISSHFRVRTHRKRANQKRPSSPRFLSIHMSAGGYHVFHSVQRGRQVTLYVHHVVAEMTYGPRPPGMQVLHRDDVKLNNHPENLYYGTPLQNARDSKRNGRHPQGETRSDAKLTESEVIEIRRLSIAGVAQRDIARRFGVAQQSISRVVTGRLWGHVENPCRAQRSCEVCNAPLPVNSRSDRRTCSTRCVQRRHKLRATLAEFGGSESQETEEVA